MNVEEAATTSNLTSFPELKGDFVDRLDEVAEKMATRNTPAPMRKRFFGMLSAA